eukprot:7216159-Ditylum_brightwellii.AAC.1
MRRSNQLNDRPADAYLTKMGSDLGIQQSPLTTAAFLAQLTKAHSFLKLLNPTQLSYVMTT